MSTAERHRPATSRVGDAEVEDLAQAMAAFTTPSRLKLLFGLVGVEKTVEDLAAATGLTANVVSQQLRVLRLLHLATGRRDGRNIRYRLHDAHITQLLEAIRHHGEHVRAADVESGPSRSWNLR